jgi:hypothetical protein
MQAGSYCLEVQPPSLVATVYLSTSVLWVEVQAAKSAAELSTYSMVPPLPAVIGSILTVNVLLRDAYGNPAVPTNSSEEQLIFSSECFHQPICRALGVQPSPCSDACIAYTVDLKS